MSGGDLRRSIAIERASVARLRCGGRAPDPCCRSSLVAADRGITRKLPFDQVRSIVTAAEVGRADQADVDEIIVRNHIFKVGFGMVPGLGASATSPSKTLAKALSSLRRLQQL